MSLKSYVLLLAVALVGGVFGGAVFGRFSVPAQAQRESSAGESRGEASTNTRKWEYCAITKAGQAPSIARGAYTITYFGPSGVRVTAIDESFSDRSAMPRAIAKLGEKDGNWSAKARSNSKPGRAARRCTSNAAGAEPSRPIQTKPGLMKARQEAAFLPIRR